MRKTQQQPVEGYPEVTGSCSRHTCISSIRIFIRSFDYIYQSRKRETPPKGRFIQFLDGSTEAKKRQHSDYDYNQTDDINYTVHILLLVTHINGFLVKLFRHRVTTATRSTASSVSGPRDASDYPFRHPPLEVPRSTIGQCGPEGYLQFQFRGQRCLKQAAAQHQRRMAQVPIW